jgi:hypothetical protein
MLKKFSHGLMFGAGFGVATVAVWLIAMSYVVPAALEKITERSPDMSGAEPAAVVPLEEKTDDVKPFKLHIGEELERKIPKEGGMLSIAVLPHDSGHSRPSTFQAWVTETEAFIISTEGEMPIIKPVPYREHKAVDYGGWLVRENVGFVKQNLTRPIQKNEIEALKKGISSGREAFLNGTFRISESGVVFFLPNEYEHK